MFDKHTFIAGVNPAMLLTKIQFNNIIPTNGNTLFPKKNEYRRLDMKILLKNATVFANGKFQF